MLYTWDYLVERADGKAHLSPELKAKDNAREQVRELALSFGARDIEDFECPEDMAEEYCKFVFHAQAKRNRGRILGQS